MCPLGGQNYFQNLSGTLKLLQWKQNSHKIRKMFVVRSHLHTQVGYYSARAGLYRSIDLALGIDWLNGSAVFFIFPDLIKDSCISKIKLKPLHFKMNNEEDVGRLCSSVVRAVDRQSKDLGSNPNAVESVFFSTERFQIL